VKVEGVAGDLACTCAVYLVCSEQRVQGRRGSEEAGANSEVVHCVPVIGAYVLRYRRWVVGVG